MFDGLLRRGVELGAGPSQVVRDRQIDKPRVFGSQTQFYLSHDSSDYRPSGHARKARPPPCWWRTAVRALLVHARPSGLFPHLLVLVLADLLSPLLYD